MTTFSEFNSVGLVFVSRKKQTSLLITAMLDSRSHESGGTTIFVRLIGSF